MPDANNIFLDTNIVLYALDADRAKRHVAWKLLFEKPCISLQVLNECSNVLIRKKQKSAEETAIMLGYLLTFVRVGPSDVATVRSAWRLQAHYHFSYYDSLILAAALSAGCTTLYSEDMQHSQIIEGRLSITNPFLSNL